MTALSIIRAGIIGLAAVVLPGAAYVAALFSTLGGVEPFLGYLAAAFVLAGALTWTCVRVAGFSAALAMVLTTFPFMIGTFLTMNMLFSGAPAAFLIQAVILAAAVGVSWSACRLAKR